MGTTQSKIQVLDIPYRTLQNSVKIQSSTYVQPFRQFESDYHKSSGCQQQSVIKINAPEQQQILSLIQHKFGQIEEAYQQRTKNFEIQAIVFDQYYTNRFSYIIKDLQNIKTIFIREFQNYDSHTFSNIMCQVKVSQQVSKLANKNLLKLNQTYIIQNQEIKFPNPRTQVLQFQGIAANLSQIIQYRRQNNWEWSQIQFNQLVYDLASGLKALHQINISHNDIRPSNIYYSTIKKTYIIGQFSYANKNVRNGNIRNNRASRNYISPQANNKQAYDLKKSDIFTLGVTLICSLFLCNPLNLQQAMKHFNKYKHISGFKTVLQMVNSQNNRRSIQQILNSLQNPKFQNKSMDDLIKSLRYKINPRNKNQKIYKQASSQFFKRLGLWEDWREQVDQILESNHNLSKYQLAQLYKQFALIDYCQDYLDESTMNAKKAAKLFRQMGQQSLSQGNLNLALKEYQHSVQCSKFYTNKYDLDLAKSLICLSKVHAQKREEQYSLTLLSQAKQLVIKQSSQESILYSQMKIKQAELKKNFFKYEESLQDLEEAFTVAKKMQGINQKASKLCQAKILTLMAQNTILLSKKQNSGDRIQLKLEKAEQYLNLSKNIYESLNEVDCHLQLAQNTEVLGLVNLEKKQYTDSKLCFEKALQMRRWYQQDKKQAPYISEHASTLSNLGRCQRLMNTERSSDIYRGALKHQQQALQIYRKVYGSDHNYYSACVLKQMGEVYEKMELGTQSRECFQCAKGILEDLFGEKSPYDQIGDVEKLLRN